MTPSEIADWHQGLSDTAAYNGEEGPCEFHANVAATIRAQAEALKIATEALDWVQQCYGHEMSEEMRTHVSQALARIKEAG